MMKLIFLVSVCWCKSVDVTFSLGGWLMSLYRVKVHSRSWLISTRNFFSFFLFPFFPLMLDLSSATLICSAWSRRLTTNIKTSVNRGWLNIADVLNSVRRRYNWTVKKKKNSINMRLVHGVTTSFSVWETVLNNWQTNKEPVFIFKWSKSQGCSLVLWTGRWTHPRPKSQFKRLLFEMNWSLCD